MMMMNITTGFYVPAYCVAPPQNVSAHMTLLLQKVRMHILLQLRQATTGVVSNSTK